MAENTTVNDRENHKKSENAMNTSIEIHEYVDHLGVDHIEAVPTRGASIPMDPNRLIHHTVASWIRDPARSASIRTHSRAAMGVFTSAGGWPTAGYSGPRKNFPVRRELRMRLPRLSAPVAGPTSPSLSQRRSAAEPWASCSQRLGYALSPGRCLILLTH